MTNTATEEKGAAGTEAPGGKMKFRTPQTTLAAAVDRVLNVVPQKTTMAALGHLLLEASGKHVKLTATDLDLTIQTSIDAEVLQDGRVTLHA